VDTLKSPLMPAGAFLMKSKRSTSAHAPSRWRRSKLAREM
jgi:hypothetical protein